jgi:acetylornithine/succinyldiaminopimelate/putrescine aminotransferase
MISNRQLFLNYIGQTSTQPLLIEIEKAEGITLYSPDGKNYLDLISGISVSNVGHRHPAVVSAVKEQVDKYMHLMVYGEVIQAPQVLLAEQIVRTLPSTLNNVYFVNSGSEAVEGALKLAKRYTGKHEIIAFKNAYHGSTQGALSLMGNEEMKRNFRPLLPGIKHLEFNNEQELDQISNETCAVIIEPMQGEAGVRIPNPSFLKKLSQRCKDNRVLLIADEIQTGFGRTGTFWAFEHFDIVPDIIVSAKGMGGGMPIGAFISSKETMAVLTDNPVLGHITTFGGHPVSCAASLATIKIINQPKFLKEVEEKGKLFKSLLKHPRIKEVRGTGLFMAIQLQDWDEVQRVIEKALAKGLLIDWFLFCNDSLRLAPPLTITMEEVHKTSQLLLECLD